MLVQIRDTSMMEIYPQQACHHVSPILFVRKESDRKVQCQNCHRHQGASIYDVRTRGGGEPKNADKWNKVA